MSFKIGVFGSAVGADKKVEENAYITGKEIANQNCILISGGCGGLPHIASKGAFENKGKTIAFSPGRDLDEHCKIHNFPGDVFTEFVFVPLDFPFAENKLARRRYRNVISCTESDAGIIIGGRIGTINEFTNLYEMGKVIGIIKGSGGAAELIPNIIKSANKANKETDAVIIYEKDPVELVMKVINRLKNRRRI